MTSPPSPLDRLRAENANIRAWASVNIEEGNKVIAHLRRDLALAQRWFRHIERRCTESYPSSLLLGEVRSAILGHRPPRARRRKP